MALTVKKISMRFSSPLGPTLFPSITRKFGSYINGKENSDEEFFQLSDEGFFKMNLQLFYVFLNLCCSLTHSMFFRVWTFIDYFASKFTRHICIVWFDEVSNSVGNIMNV